jgi:RNA polymerase sigma factor (sigma-70 family)
MIGFVTSVRVVRSIGMSSASAPTAPEDPPVSLERAHPVARTDETLLAGIYEERRTELFAFLVHMTHDAEAAEDLLQDTFLRLIHEARAGRMPDQVRPWLYRVAANAAIDRSRRGATLARFLPRLFTREEPPAPEGEALRSDRDATLHAALAHLSPDRRAALLLAAHGFSGAEVARALGRSEMATRALLCRARLELRGLLDPAEVAP